ncbi:hypothetical protein [[Clostridium] polysaccharolyticum]|jgi:hypothetical protein|uniref:Uncharacterized protein n=1 Tax=[Clostridium] polysaccharolyticum TaxID=29364 RepID=A0A1H9Y6Z6_9FIRM|nr:hypothetical protein [[Clostridium] polysaccharolyticum]SES64569.1 hypothetical protein SAMN04487772_101181 [[Clostridium] polysaccharolyticum]
MKNKVIVAVLSMALIALVLACYFNYDGPRNVMSGGTLVSAQIDL